MITSKYTSVAAHFEGLADASVLASPKQHVQGYSGSHWMLPLGVYFLCIALAAAGWIANSRITMKNAPTLLAISMVVAMHWYDAAHNAR